MSNVKRRMMNDEVTANCTSITLLSSSHLLKSFYGYSVIHNHAHQSNLLCNNSRFLFRSPATKIGTRCHRRSRDASVTNAAKLLWTSPTNPPKKFSKFFKVVCTKNYADVSGVTSCGNPSDWLFHFQPLNPGCLQCRSFSLRCCLLSGQRCSPAPLIRMKQWENLRLTFQKLNSQ